MGSEQIQSGWLENTCSVSNHWSTDFAWILNQLNDAIALFDVNYRLVCFNKRLASLWEISADWLQNQPSWEQIQTRLLTQGKWLPQDGQRLQQALMQPDHSSLTLVPRGGEPLEIRINISKTVEKLVIFRTINKPQRAAIADSSSVDNQNQICNFQEVELASSEFVLSCSYADYDDNEHTWLSSIATDTTALKQVDKQQWNKNILQRHNLRSQLCAEISLKIRRSLQIDDILQTTVAEVRTLLQCDRTLIYRFESGNSGAVITEAVLPDHPELLGCTFNPDVFPGDYQQLYRLGATRVIDAIEPTDEQPSDSDRRNIALLKELGVKTALIVPILARDLLWGLLVVHECSSVRQWSDDEIELLQQITDQVGIALAQAQLLQALQESEERFRVMANTAPVMLWVAGTDTRCTFFNRPWLEFTGRAIDRETGNGWIEGVHPDDLSLCMETYLHAFDTRERFSIEYRLRRADGVYRWVLAIGAPLFMPDGNFAGYIGSCIDITERKQAEAETRKALEREKELNELKSRFVAMTSHEFRTPLSTILLSAGLLERYSSKWTEDKKHKHLQRIQTAVKRMTQLLDDVLLLGKAEAGKLEFSPIPLNLEEFCQELIEEMQLNASTERELTFSSQGVPVTACLDKKLLRSILSNLLSNAIKYSFKGSNVQFQLLYREKDVVFQVHDRGIGIPLEDQKHLFESFHRARNAVNLPGTGLGLAIAKRCIDLHGGQVEIDSVVGEGTTFTVTLPLLQPDQPNQYATPPLRRV